MQDTLYQKITDLALKTDALTQSVDKLSEKSKLVLFTPIIAALITAVLGTLLAQAIDRMIRNNRETQKDLREIHSKSINIKIRLKDLLRQLAMYKFHAQYWWHVHYKEGDKEFRNKYYLEHLRSQADARNIEKEIGQAKADFLAEIVKFEKLKGKKFNVDNEKIEIENIVFEKAERYKASLSVEELRENIAERDEQELRGKYFMRLEVFQSIINKMN